MTGIEFIVLIALPVLIASAVAILRRRRRTYWGVLIGLLTASIAVGSLFQRNEPLVNGPLVGLLSFVAIPVLMAFLAAAHPLIRRSSILSFAAAAIAYPAGLILALVVGVNAGYLSP